MSLSVCKNIESSFLLLQGALQGEFLQDEPSPCNIHGKWFGGKVPRTNGEKAC